MVKAICRCLLVLFACQQGGALKFRKHVTKSHRPDQELLKRLPLTNIALMAELSALVHINNPELKGKYTTAGPQAFGFPKQVTPASGDNSTMAEVWLDSTAKVMMIAFRAHKDASTKRLERETVAGAGTGNVDKVYLNCFTELQADLKTLLSRYAGEFSTLVFTGHQGGAAVATIAAAVLVDTVKGVDVQVFTYGSPRVGDLEFKAWYRSRVKTTWRITNEGDPIPQEPMLHMIAHVMKAVKLLRKGGVRMQADAPLMLRPIRTARNMKTRGPILDEYSIKSYITRIKALQEASKENTA